MGGGNVDMWTCGMIACMYIVFSCNIVVAFRTILKQLPHVITMQLKKNSNMGDYICMYDVYKLSYRRPIFNSLATIQLIDFLT